MKQPQYAPKGSIKTPKAKRKSREELNAEAKERKRKKKHRGHASGSRTNVSSSSQSSSRSGRAKDPRIGSKTPIQLTNSDEQMVQKMRVDTDTVHCHEPLSREKELDRLENDERLNELLDALEAGKSLSDEEHDYINDTLDRIDELMVQLGIDLGEEDESEDDSAKKQDDILSLLKRKD